MSISTPPRPSSRGTDPADRTSHESAHEPSERRSFPGWRWMAVWPAFPVAGYIGWKVGGRVDAVDAALVGGALTGAGLGAVQWWAAKGALGRAAAWIGASAVGYAVGLAAGAALVGYETDLGALALMGLVSGAALGAAQGLVLPGRDAARSRCRGRWRCPCCSRSAGRWHRSPASASMTSSRCSAPAARCCSRCSAASCSRASPPPAHRRRDGRRRPCRARRRRRRDGHRRGAGPPRRVGARRQPLRAARAGGGRPVRHRRRHRSGVRGLGDARRARRLPGAEPAVSPLGAGLPRPASGGDRRRPEPPVRGWS